MRDRLTDRLVLTLPAPAKNNKVYFDAPNRNGADWTPGFGLCVTPAGHRSFILDYRDRAGQQRRLTIGSPPAWTVAAARREAAERRRDIDAGSDPRAEQEAAKRALNVAELCDRYERDELTKRRNSTRAEYSAIIKSYIRPAIGKLKILDVRHDDIDRLHRRIADHAPYRANRTVAVLSRMFNLAIKWQLRTDNPAKGIERNPEHKRERFLSAAELARLAEALAARPCPSADAIRLLLLTGARRGEILGATWSQFDLENGIWVKPAATTKQAKLHRVPLKAALQLLLSMRGRSGDSPYLFPGPRGGPQHDLKKYWAGVCKAAQIEGARVHDLRHTFASVLASSGLGLPVIGALLGHSQPSTASRYAHLLDDPLRAATERAAAVITAAQTADIVPMPNRERAR
jgi:integrase